MKIWMKNYDNWWQLINWLLSFRIHYLWNEMHFVWDFGSTDQIWLKKRILLVTLLNPWVIEDNQLWCPQVPDRLEECRLECEAVNWVNQYVTLLHTTIDWMELTWHIWNINTIVSSGHMMVHCEVMQLWLGSWHN